MSLPKLRLASLLFLALAAVSASAQTVVAITENDASTSPYTPCFSGAGAPCKIGENIGTPLPTDNADFYANLFQATNAGFERQSTRSIYAVAVGADTTHLVVPSFYTSGSIVYPAGHYNGAQILITSTPYLGLGGYNGAEKGCAATVTASPVYPGVLGASASATSFSIASNVVTIVAANSYQAGMIIQPAGFATGSYLNGAFLTVASASSSQFTSSFTHANVASTTDAATLTAQDELTLSSACGAATQAGDIFTMAVAPVATPGSVWMSGGYFPTGATAFSDVTTPCDGAQSMGIDTTATGYATYALAADEVNLNNWHLVRGGNYQISVCAKNYTGTSGSFSVTVQRGGSGSPLCTANFTTTTSWQTLTSTCTNPNESASVAVGGLTFLITQTSANQVGYDDVSFMQVTNRDATNTSNVNDNDVASERFFDGGTSSTIWGAGRDWEVQFGQTYANWIKPASQADLACYGDPYKPTCYSLTQLPDTLKRFQIEHRIPFIVVPSAFSDAEWVSLVNFLTTVQAGMTQPWVSHGGVTGIFPTIHLTIGNENWNTAFYAGGLGYRNNCGTSTCIVTDYANRAGQVLVAARGASGYTPNIVLSMNVQTGYAPGLITSNGAGSDYAHMVAHPDEFDMNLYSQSSVSDFDTEADLWAGAINEPDFNFTGTTSSSGIAGMVAQLKTMSSCGPSGTAQCGTAIYEWSPGTSNGCSSCSGIHNQPITQTVLAEINQGGGNLITSAKSALFQLQNGIAISNYFALTGYGQNLAFAGGAGTLFQHTWHVMVDEGGACSALNAALFGGKMCPSPAAIGVSMVNAAIIGRPVPCTNNGPAPAFAGSNNGPVPALSSVPDVDTQCFADGLGNRSLLVINASQVNPYTLNLAGTTMTGTVTVKKASLTSLNLMNEVTGAGATNAFTAQVPLPVTSTLSSPVTDSIAKNAVSLYTWNVNAVVVRQIF